MGIEEPENYVHPAALSAFAEHVLAVYVVRRVPTLGTLIAREERPEAVRQALEESGFGLGELHETKGFGA